MKVPFIDLATQYNSLKPEIDQALNAVLTSGSFIGGEFQAVILNVKLKHLICVT